MSNYKDSRPLNVDLDYDSLDILCPTFIRNSLVVTGTITDNSSVKTTGQIQIPNNTASVNIFTMTTLPGRAYLLDINAIGYQPSTGNSYATKQSSKFWNNAGVVSSVLAFSNSFSNGIAGGALNYVVAGSVVTVSISQTANPTSLANWGYEAKFILTG